MACGSRPALSAPAPAGWPAVSLHESAMAIHGPASSVAVSTLPLAGPLLRSRVFSLLVSGPITQHVLLRSSATGARAHLI